MDGLSIPSIGHISVTKMKIKLSSFLIIAATLILNSGCTQVKRSTLSIGKPMMENNQIARTKDNEIIYETIGTIFVWDTDVSTAVMNKEGHTCIQRALTTKDIAASGVLSDSILNLTKTLEKTQNPKERELLSVAIAQTSTLLTTTTERTAFLDTGLFYICQLGANKALTQSEVVTLSQEVIKSAAGLETNKASTVINTHDNLPRITKPIPPIIPTQPRSPEIP